MSSERRNAKRRSTNIPGRILFDDAVHPCVVLDVSRSGARLNFGDGLTLPRKFVLDLTNDGRVVRSCELVHQDGLSAGVRFIHGSSPQSMAFAPSLSAKRLDVEKFSIE